jgi:TonB family protein
MSFALDVVAKPTIVLLSAVALSVLLRRSSASVRHAVWLLAITSAVLLPLLSITFAGLLTISLAAIGVTAAVPPPPVFIGATKFVPAAAAPKPAAKPPAVRQRTRIGNAGTIPNNAVIPPKVLESKPPTYTPEAVRNRIEGIVTLESAVNAEGKVAILRVVKGLGFGLDEKARRAVLEWKFSPATRNGVPVEAITQIDVEFTIPVWWNPPEDDMPAIRMGPGVTPPVVVFRVEPEYTEEARKEKLQGTVVVEATIHQDGRLTVGNVVRGLDHGLTEKAIEALELWKFKPGMRNGKADP